MNQSGLLHPSWRLQLGGFRAGMDFQSFLWAVKILTGFDNFLTGWKLTHLSRRNSKLPLKTFYNHSWNGQVLTQESGAPVPNPCSGAYTKTPWAHLFSLGLSFSYCTMRVDGVGWDEEESVEESSKPSSSLTFLGLCFAPGTGLVAENPNLLPPALSVLTPLQAGDPRPSAKAEQKKQ